MGDEGEGESDSDVEGESDGEGENDGEGESQSDGQGESVIVSGVATKWVKDLKGHTGLKRRYGCPRIMT